MEEGRDGARSTRGVVAAAEIGGSSRGKVSRKRRGRGKAASRQTLEQRRRQTGEGRSIHTQ